MTFFVLQNPKAGDGDAVTDYLPLDDSKIGVAPRCPVCGKFLGMLPLIPPVKVEIRAWGMRWGDIVFGSGDELMVSDKLKTLFSRSHLVGITRFDPIAVVKVDKRSIARGEPPTYWMASIQRSRTLVDEGASGVIRDDTPVCEYCLIGGVIQRASGIVLRSSTWGGEDVFFARGLPGIVFASDRFKRLCEANDLANCSLVAAEEFSFDHGL